MADESQPHVGEPVYKDRYARYRAKNREKRRQESADWWCKNGAVYREANRERLREIAAKHRETNRDKVRERVRKFQSDHPDRQRDSERRYRAAHKDRRKASCAAYRAKDGVLERERLWRRAWAIEHRAELAAKAAKRRALKMRATPAWADLDAIAAVYAECRRLTLETGIPHHVDHIVPLKSKTVCGLHVETNLQILTGHDNLSKGNRVWPDQW